ncbi:MAG: SDR family NAD(P)-dependent oxidoreductase [Acidobacteriaceae bacterium]
MAGLKDHVAVITGSSSGIGQGIAKRFAEEGARVVIDYVGHPDGADQTLKMVEQAGSKGIICQADVTKIEDTRRLVDAAYSEFGSLDILVNNAGMEKEADFWEVQEADYDKVLAVNLKGPFFLTQYFVQKLLAANKPGRIVNISSVHEDMVFPGFSTYCISKGGMRMFMRDLSVELGPKNITINNIAPGAIETPINKKLMANKGEMQALLQNIPLNRLGTVDDVAALAAFLASDDAGYITGSTYVIDGGLMRSYHEQ